MRFALAILFTFIAALPIEIARADPYPWCAVYGGSDDYAGTSCYMMTLQQCHEAVSGVGGFCTRNQFYDGRPVTTPRGGVPSRRRVRATH